MPNKHEITAADILSMDVYGRERADRRKAMTEIKRNRRIAVGPDATFYFESFDTMFHQVHEMLFIEKGGEAQIPEACSSCTFPSPTPRPPGSRTRAPRCSCRSAMKNTAISRSCPAP